jgi:hypothetical protein
MVTTTTYVCLPQRSLARMFEIFGSLLDALQVNSEAAVQGVVMLKPMAEKIPAAVAEVRHELVEIGASAVVGTPVHDDSRGSRLAVH